jgi:hypothetical protein
MFASGSASNELDAAAMKRVTWYWLVTPTPFLPMYKNQMHAVHLSTPENQTTQQNHYQNGPCMY